ncbi:MAG: Gfo/Idh/MocA family oxidoreductase [Nakamurella sp.]
MSQPSTARPLGVAVAGFGWMGRVHTQAYARVRHHFPDLALHPTLVAVADDVPGRADAAADQFGFAAATTDWRDLATNPQVLAVSVTAPNFLHREIGVTLAEAGKHIWIEKPVGLSADDARAVQTAATRSGVQSAVGFNYRNAPAVRYAKLLIDSGELGAVTHAGFRFLSDYAAHPEGALSWRFERARGGHGVLGDLASHGVDLIWYLLGDPASLVADTTIFLPERSRPAGVTSGHQRAVGGALGPVENEDWVSSLIRMGSGARVSLEASRVAVGEQNRYGFEIHGTKGILTWDYRRMGELRVGFGDRHADQDVATVFVGPGHGDFGAFQPGAANPMGYDDLKVIELRHFLTAIETGRPSGATIADAVRSAETLDAIVESVASGSWVTLA